MTTTFDQTFTGSQEMEQERIPSVSAPRFPLLFWAAMSLLLINLGIALSIWLSPGLTPSVLADGHRTYDLSSRPSPFLQTVAARGVTKVKQPEKIYPVVTTASLESPAEAREQPDHVIAESSLGYLSEQP